jgi:hypothetical protein
MKLRPPQPTICQTFELRDYCYGRIHKGFKISGSSIPMYMEGCESLGPLCKPGANGSVIEVARIEGKIFKMMREVEAHGLELAREWMDQRCSEL